MYNAAYNYMPGIEIKIISNQVDQKVIDLARAAQRINTVIDYMDERVPNSAIESYTLATNAAEYAARTVVSVDSQVHNLMLTERTYIQGLFMQIRDKLPEQFHEPFMFLTDFNPLNVLETHSNHEVFDFQKINERFKTKDERLFMAAFICQILESTSEDEFLNLWEIEKDPYLGNRADDYAKNLQLTNPSAVAISDRFNRVGHLERMLINLDLEVRTLLNTGFIENSLGCAIRYWAGIPVRFAFYRDNTA